MSKVFGKTSLPFWRILGLLILFYPGLFLGKTASLAGDHWEQHFPWARLLFDSLRHFDIPYWTPLIHCGFPITAEGQIGSFYLPNIVLSLLLPFHFAYSYANVIHFLISGLGTYGYARQMKLTQFPALAAAFIFLFGTAYGGAFYNVTSLKTISWFPIGLFLLEKYLQKSKAKYLALLSVVIALSLLAGYLQVALFTWFIFLLYVVLRLFIFSDSKAKTNAPLSKFCLVFVAFVGAFVLATPQLYLTFKLALSSNRANLTEDYAYVGSMSPLALLTFILPIFQGFLRGNSLYGGVFSVFLVLCAVHSQSIRKGNFFRLWITLAIISFLLALGEWSPLYTALVKLTRFYSFRVPAKFLVFICFSVAMLAGMGVQAILKSKAMTEKGIRSAARMNAIILSSACAVYAFVYYFVAYRRSISVAWGQWFVENFIHGRLGHPHSLEIYTEKLNAALKTIQATLALTNPWNIWSLLMVGIAFFLTFTLGRFWKSKKTFLGLASAFMILDLYAFAIADIKRDFGTYGNVFQANSILERLEEERGEGRLGRIYGYRREGENLPLVPSANMLYSIADIGVYSPFVLSRYYESIGQLGNINDSNRAMSPPPEYVKDRLELLAGLGVTHILSTLEISHPSLELLAQDVATNARLYRLLYPSARVYFISDMEVVKDWSELREKFMAPGFDPQKKLLLEENEISASSLNDFTPARLLRGALFGKNSTFFSESVGDLKLGSRFRGNDKTKGVRPAGLTPLGLLRRNDDSEIWSVETDRPGFFILTNTFYPGWRAIVNGQEIPILRAYGLFQAVWLGEPGQYQIEFKYHPYR